MTDKPTTKRPQPDPQVVHLVTVGTTLPGTGPDVIDALIEDLKGQKPARLVVIATSDSLENAVRLRKGLGLPAAAMRIREIDSAQSLDAAYEGTSTELAALLAEGIPPGHIILHYTAGTKVMSAGAVMAALRYEIQSLRYLYSPGRGQRSESVITSPGVILLDQRMRMAVTMIRDLRFRSAQEILRNAPDGGCSTEQQERSTLLRSLAQAYLEWDNFRVAEFLRLYDGIAGALAKRPEFKSFLLTQSQRDALRRIANAEADGSYPEELLLDMLNNAIRRLAERRPDDALTRLHRAAELFAQTVLMADHGIRTDDVEIRRVPPRYRSAFEAERRLDDATIKLGLRKSFELLAALGNPVGLAFQQAEGMAVILRERRHLILGHGTKPATLNQALSFLKAVEDLMALRFPDLRAHSRRQQFPWIDNNDVLTRLGRAPAATESVIVEKAEKQERPRAASAPAKAGTPPAKPRKRS